MKPLKIETECVKADTQVEIDAIHLPLLSPEIVVGITSQQQRNLRPMFEKAAPGGAVWAQIWPDGMRVVVLSPRAVKLVQQALGTESDELLQSAHQPRE